jgi:hypothetical protein
LARVEQDPKREKFLAAEVENLSMPALQKHLAKQGDG